jgi:hypothetical protein
MQVKIFQIQMHEKNDLFYNYAPALSQLENFRQNKITSQTLMPLSTLTISTR